MPSLVNLGEAALSYFLFDLELSHAPAAGLLGAMGRRRVPHARHGFLWAVVNGQEGGWADCSPRAYEDRKKSVADGVVM